MEWVPINLNIPQLGKSVLVVDSKTGYMECADFQEIEGCICICTIQGYGLCSDSQFTHWQFLPSPPKQKDNA